MKTTSYAQVCADAGPGAKRECLEFVQLATPRTVLKPDQFFSVMVTTTAENPHCKGRDEATGDHLVGVESDSSGKPYVSRDYKERPNSARGNSMVVNVLKPADVIELVKKDLSLPKRKYV